MQRVSRLREQENLFVDTMDDYYLNFYRNVKPSYDEWRYATYDEAVRLRRCKNKRVTAAAGARSQWVYADHKAKLGLVMPLQLARSSAESSGESGMDRYKQRDSRASTGRTDSVIRHGDRT